MASNTGIVDIHGKQYSTVAKRVSDFREKYPHWTIRTKLLHADEETCIVKASILDDQSRIIATGIAEENRKATQINRTSAVENCETSAVGRALAFFGMGGTEIASAEEVQNAIQQQSKKQTNVAATLAEEENSWERVDKAQVERILHDLDQSLHYDAKFHRIEPATDLEAIRAIYEEMMSSQDLVNCVWSELGKWNKGKVRGPGSATKNWLKKQEEAGWRNE